MRRSAGESAPDRSRMIRVPERLRGRTDNVITTFHGEAYQEAILLDGLIPLFLPLCTVDCGGRRQAVYFTDGFLPAASAESWDAASLIALLTELIGNVADAKLRYFFPGEYWIQKDLLYLNRENRAPRLIFCRRRGGDVRHLVADLRTLAEELTKNGWRGTLQEKEQILRLLSGEIRDLRILPRQLSLLNVRADGGADAEEETLISGPLRRGLV